jgi:uncharacterized protein (DUF2062 family)
VDDAPPIVDAVAVGVVVAAVVGLLVAVVVVGAVRFSYPATRRRTNASASSRLEKR